MMALPNGVLNLQQVVRDLEKRLSALEEVEAGRQAAFKELADGPKEEAGGAPEPAKTA
jgi:hypothetical protein